MPESLIPKAEEVKRLTHEQTEENLLLRHDNGTSDPIALLHRVRRGEKPVGVFLVRRQREFFMTETSVMQAAHKMGMRSLVCFARGGRRVVAVYHDAVTLGQFYDAEDVIARFLAVGVALERDLFSTPLELLARPLASNDFPSDLGGILAGLCMGHPVRELVDMVLAQGRPSS